MGVAPKSEIEGTKLREISILQMTRRIGNGDDREGNCHGDQRKKNQALAVFFFGEACCGNPMGSEGMRLFR